MKTKPKKICTCCIYDDTMAGISFDDNGVCNYCHTMERLVNDYGTGNEKGEKTLNDIIERIKKEGKRKKYDCVVGVSGGTDSSYLLIKLKEWGLRPLAVHYDNTWNTAIATENIKIMTSALDVDLYTYVIDNNEADDIFKAFLRASVPELDASTDLALMEVLYRAAAKYKVKYIIEGHSFVAEGISPLSNMYFDGGYIKDIHRKFGEMPMKTYPLMHFWKFMYWTLIKRIKRIRPFWYIEYSKEHARNVLTRDYGWKYYGGHHLENRITLFHHSWLNYKKFGNDTRNLSLAAGVRSKLIDRDAAIKEYYETEPVIDKADMDYFKRRLGFDDKDLEDILKAEHKTYKDYKTYKKYFHMLRPLFFICMKANLVPESFYIKYTGGD